ncbi:hypothetical protein QJS83_04350 [Bdellovibrio sp. 22V]|uniref:hypothetical protein n=1 Tax=Bdellovibrio TaxID=958 RepID=UPI002543D992|nr:hypothetical protein [Bdellovibrio sp. 22V]WII73102.1 hypothetical protein QJS83_04350 [Bdellovibrio sp. 22V]
MKKIVFVLMTLMLFGVNAHAWEEVAYEIIYAEDTTYRDISLRNSSEKEYSEVKVQFMSEGVRLQRVELITDRMRSIPVWHLEGDYKYGDVATDTFEKTKIRAMRFYVTTLEPLDSVRLVVFLQ